MQTQQVDIQLMRLNDNASEPASNREARQGLCLPASGQLLQRRQAAGSAAVTFMLPPCNLARTNERYFLWHTSGVFPTISPDKAGVSVPAGGLPCCLTHLVRTVCSSAGEEAVLRDLRRAIVVREEERGPGVSVPVLFGEKF